MKRRFIGLAALISAAALGQAGNALADPGNTATNSTGVAQVGAVATDPTVSSTGNSADGTASVPVSTAGSGNTATDSTGAAQSGGTNTSSDSTEESRAGRSVSGHWPWWSFA